MKLLLVLCILFTTAYADLMSEMEAFERELETMELSGEDASSLGISTDIFDDLAQRFELEQQNMVEQKRVRRFVVVPVPHHKCVDTTTKCHIYEKFCKVYKKNLITLCPKTCGYCAEPTPTTSPAEMPAACKDRLPKNTCNMAKKMCYAEDSRKRTRIQMLCADTCQVCAPPVPELCEITEFGCCWDKESIKRDPEGTNCPACEDEFRYICKTFKNSCSRISHSSGLFMSKNCKQTCGLCNNNYCEDDPKFSKSCFFWKKYLKECEKETSMKGLCRKTCGLCDKETEEANNAK